MTEFAIELPNPADPEAERVSYDTYAGRAEALAAAAHRFGADEQGRISIVSEAPQGDGD
jgi:hypothetical protein